MNEAGNIKHESQHPHGHWEQSDKIIIVKSNKPNPATENTEKLAQESSLLTEWADTAPTHCLPTCSALPGLPKRFPNTSNSRQQNHLCGYQNNSDGIKMDRHLEFTGAVNFSNSLHSVSSSMWTVCKSRSLELVTDSQIQWLSAGVWAHSTLNYFFFENSKVINTPNQWKPSESCFNFSICFKNKGSFIFFSLSCCEGS